MSATVTVLIIVGAATLAQALWTWRISRPTALAIGVVGIAVFGAALWFRLHP